MVGHCHRPARGVKWGRATCQEARMKIVRNPSLLFSLLLTAGCGAPTADDASTDAEAAAVDPAGIQGGAVDAGDPAVGLVWIRGGGFCSGALIAPDLVLTAGHCVEQEVAGFYTGTGSGALTVGR